MMKTMIAATLTLALGLFASLPQEEGTTTNDINPRLSAINSNVITSNQDEIGGVNLTYNWQHGDEFRTIQNKVAQATRKLKKAESSDERSEAKQELRKALADDYKYRLAEYEEYLDGLEKKLATMRDKLQRRRNAEDDMIDLRIQVLEAEANDLGWPSAPSNTGRTLSYLNPPPGSIGAGDK